MKKEEPRLRMVCETCGSTDVSRDAWGDWDEEAQEWVLGSVYDYAFCHFCDGETHIQELPLK